MGYIGEGINQTATSVETAKDEFFGTYYGQISSDPTVDPNGEAITDGDLFYNTSEEALKIRVNGEWLSLRTATTGYQQFTATSGQTTFNVAGSFSPGFVFVTLNGVVLASGDYDDSSGTSIVLTSGAADGDILGVYLFDTFSVADTVSASAGGTFSGPVDFSDNINVDSGTLFVDSANNRVGIRTSSPDADIEILQTAGNPGANGGLRITASDGNVYPGIYIQDESGNASQIRVRRGGLNENGRLQIRSDNGILFEPSNSEAARIDSSGNVGIGTSSPEAKLDVNGGALLDGISMQTFSEGDTGISVNQSSSGGIALLLATSNFNVGTAVDSGLYLLKFFVDGDNTPALIHIAGDDFASISQSSNNTLVINGVSGNDRYAIIGFSPIGQMLS